MSPKTPKPPEGIKKRRRKRPAEQVAPPARESQPESISVEIEPEEDLDVLRLLTLFADHGSLPQYPRPFLKTWIDPSEFTPKGTIWSSAVLRDVLARGMQQMNFPEARKPEAVQKAKGILLPILDRLSRIIDEAEKPTPNDALRGAKDRQPSGAAIATGDIVFSGIESADLPVAPPLPGQAGYFDPNRTRTSRELAEDELGGDRVAHARALIDDLDTEIVEAWEAAGAAPDRPTGQESHDILQKMGLAPRIDLARFGDVPPVELSTLRGDQVVTLEHLRLNNLQMRPLRPRAIAKAERHEPGKGIFLVGVFLEIAPPAEGADQTPLTIYHRFTDEELGQIGMATREEPVYLGKQESDDTHIRVLPDEIMTQSTEGDAPLSREHVALFTGPDSIIRVVDVSANGGVSIVAQTEAARKLENYQKQFYREQKKQAEKQRLEFGGGEDDSE